MNDVECGVFFSMPEDEYHAIPALSASGVKNLLVSPMDFWARSWMNPAREDDVDSDARTIGRAYHKRILEGKAAFDRCYAPTFEAPDGCLKTVEDLKAVLSDRGLPVSGKKDDLIDRLLTAWPEAKIHDLEKLRYEDRNAGKEFLSPKLISKIEISAAMIEKHPHLSKCFTGGYPEVSVVWKEDGIFMKARFDYLKPRAIIDLKTFANQMNKPIDRAIYAAMASGKYHIQAAFYLMAVRAMQELKNWQVSHACLPNEWIKEFEACDEHGFYFVFQQKGMAPLARGKKFPRGMVYGAGVAAVHDAITTYKRCLATFGTDPWLDTAAIDEFSDDEFPAYTCEL